jgi:hypothetical protein
LWRAQKAEIGADIVPASQAELAVIAIQSGFERHAIAFGPSVSGLFDDASRFVP